MPVYWASLLKTPDFLSPSPEAFNFEEARLQNLETGVGYSWWSSQARSMEKGTWLGGGALEVLLPSCYPGTGDQELSLCYGYCGGCNGSSWASGGVFLVWTLQSVFIYLLLQATSLVPDSQ